MFPYKILKVMRCVQLFEHLTFDVRRLLTEQILEPEARYPVNLLKTFAQLDVAAVMQARLEIRDNAVAVESAHSQNKGKSKFLAVRGVKRLQSVEFFLSAQIEAGAALLSCGFVREFAPHRSLAGKLGVGVNQSKLPRFARLVDDRRHDVMKLVDARERPLPKRRFRHPRRVFEDTRKRADKRAGGQRIELV